MSWYVAASRLHSPSILTLVLASTGFGDRLLNELRKIGIVNAKIKIYAPPERKYSTWIGGSILAGLNAFKKVRSLVVRALQPFS